MSAVAVGDKEGKPPTQPSKQARGGEPGEMEAQTVDHKHKEPGSKERSGHQGFNAAVSTAHSTGSSTEGAEPTISSAGTLLPQPSGFIHAPVACRGTSDERTQFSQTKSIVKSDAVVGNKCTLIRLRRI